MEYKVYAQDGNSLYGATVIVDGKFVVNGTKSRYGESIAFVRGNAGKWRSIEWVTVPDAVKDALFNKAIAKAA
jgi:hypothetical protein